MQDVAWSTRALASDAGAPTAEAPPSAQPSKGGKQPVDYTTLVAAVAELNRDWVPAKIEQVLQVDGFTLVLRLRTLEDSTWLYISRHDTGCHMAVGEAPTRGSTAEAFRYRNDSSRMMSGHELQSMWFCPRGTHRGHRSCPSRAALGNRCTRSCVGLCSSAHRCPLHGKG